MTTAPPRPAAEAAGRARPARAPDRGTPTAPNREDMQEKSTRIIVTVIGEDKVGIIAAVAGVLAEANVNIVDISQTTLREFFTMILMADMANASVPFDELKRRLNAKGEALGLKVDAQHEDVFKYMHRV